MKNHTVTRWGIAYSNEEGFPGDETLYAHSSSFAMPALYQTEAKQYCTHMNRFGWDYRVVKVQLAWEAK